MGKYIKVFNNHNNYYNHIMSGQAVSPNVSYCMNENEVHYNPEIFASEYFTTIARENGTISFNIWKNMGTNEITSISYSTDDGETWNTTNNTNNKSEHLVITVNVSEDDKVLWKGNATQTGYYNVDDYADAVGSFFSSTCEFDAQGNVMSLLYGDNFKNKTTIENVYAFAHLFSDYDEENECKVVNARNLSLPATTLTNACYDSMFDGCTSLTTAPELPATTLAGDCYHGMFRDCSSLTTAPELPATTLAESCYSGMLRGCTSLTTAPVLSATTLTERCYYNMFNECTSLTTAPELPATTLTNGCYDHMFAGCTSLTTAPELPATTLTNGCYQYMFQGCTNLNYIMALFTTTPNATYTNNWVRNVAASGTFVKNSAATWNITGSYGIPTGWTVQTASN